MMKETKGTDTRSFWHRFFSHPELPQPSVISTPNLEMHHVAVVVRCPSIDVDAPVAGAAVDADIPLGATHIQLWSSVTHPVARDAPLAAALVGIDPKTLVRAPGRLSFRPRWVRVSDDPVAAESQEATLLVTFDL
jgi:hypothetical protein